MNPRALLFLIVLFTFWSCDDAGRVVVSTTSLPTVPEKWKIQNEMGSDGDWCTFCEVILVPTVDKLSNTTTQEETLIILHLFCALTIIVKAECNAVVDHYVPLIFNETSTLTPREICQKIGLCGINQTDYHHHIHNLSENNYESCNDHQAAAVTQPYSDKQMQIIQEKLLEACNSVEDSAHVTDCCKRIVLAKCSDYPKTVLRT